MPRASMLVSTLVVCLAMSTSRMASAADAPAEWMAVPELSAPSHEPREVFELLERSRSRAFRALPLARATTAPSRARGRGAPPAPDDGNWWDGFALPVVDGRIRCIVQYQGEIVIGGEFDHVGKVEAHHVARWTADGHWLPLGDGTDREVTSLIEYDGALIVGGEFSSAGGVVASGIARWDSSGWAPLGGGLAAFGTPPTLVVLTVYHGDLIATGRFDTAGGVAASNIARWNGTAWAPLLEGIDGLGFSLAVFEDRLIVGGTFHVAGSTPASGIAAWDGAGWDSLGTGVSSPPGDATVYALAVLGTRLIAGGQFTDAGGVTAINVAAWNGAAWDSLGSGVLNIVEALAVRRDSLFAGTFGFPQAMSRWDGAAWQPVGSFDGEILCFLPLDSALVIGGDFAAYDPSSDYSRPIGYELVGFRGPSDWTAFEDWSPPMNGLAGAFGLFSIVGALITHEGSLVAGGLYGYGGIDGRWLRLPAIARWDGSSWHPMGDLPQGFVRALTEWGTDLIAGGYFFGPLGITGVARWDGTAWGLMGLLPIQVDALATYGGALYAGGFDNGSNSSAAGVYRWNGTTWDAVGVVADSGGSPPVVRALAVVDGRLVAAGSFRTIDGVDAFDAAAWDGVSWQPFDNGFRGTHFTSGIQALAVRHGELFAGGSFFIDSVSAVARWDGTEWHTVGRLEGFAFTLGVHHDRICAGGLFHPHNDSQSTTTVEYQGTQWASLGSGTDGQVLALQSYQNQLYVGGLFRTAGGKLSVALARWDKPLLPIGPPPLVAFGVIAPNPFGATTQISYSFRVPGRTRLVIHDLAGREVRRLVDGYESAGPHSVTWDGLDAEGRKQPIGIYLARLTLNGRSSQSRKLALVR